MVEVKQSDRHASDCCQRQDMGALQDKVVFPDLGAGVKERSQLIEIGSREAMLGPLCRLQ